MRNQSMRDVGRGGINLRKAQPFVAIDNEIGIAMLRTEMGEIAVERWRRSSDHRHVDPARQRETADW